MNTTAFLESQDVVPKRWLLILIVGLGSVLNPLNSSMVAVALTQMQYEFNLTFADISWMVSIFYLGSVAGQPIMGKLSDMFGAKRLFITGLIVVFIACALAPFSPNYGFLLACRALQAIGSSAVFPSGMIMVRDYITKRQAQAIATVSIFASTSAAFGPSIGGFLLAGWSWPAIFIINLPLVFVSVILSILYLPASSSIKMDLRRIDFVGITLFTASITGLILFLLSLAESPRWWALIIFIVTGIFFYRFEKRIEEPFIDIEALEENKNVLLIYMQFITLNFVMYNYFFGFPTMLQQVRMYSEGQAGLIMLAFAGFGVFVTPIAGQLIDRKGSKISLVFGAFVLMVGTALLLTYDGNSPLIWLLFIMAILGISNGFSNISAQTALYEHISPEDTGSASGLFQTSRYLGAILSVSFLGISFDQHVDDEHFQFVVMISLVFSFVVAFMALRVPGRKKMRNR